MKGKFHKGKLEVTEKSLTSLPEAPSRMDRSEFVWESMNAGIHSCQRVTVKGARERKLFLCVVAISGEQEPSVQMREEESEAKLTAACLQLPIIVRDLKEYQRGWGVSSLLPECRAKSHKE